MTDRRRRIAVLGATGLVGEALVEQLVARDFPIDELMPLASGASVGRSVEFRGRQLAVRDAAGFDFARAGLVFCCAPEPVAARYVPRALAAGCVVLDASGLGRDDPQLPLVVAELCGAVELAAIAQARRAVSPAAASVGLALTLAPLQRAFGIERLELTSCEAVSGAGRAGVDELAAQATELLSGRGPVEPRVLPQQAAFNVIPQVAALERSGQTAAEIAIATEIGRLLNAPALQTHVTCLRVPVFFGHSIVVQAATRDPVELPRALDALCAAPGVRVSLHDQDGGYPTAASVVAGADGADDVVHVGRVRLVAGQPRALSLWVVLDNVRRGAASNLVRIGEALVRGGL